MHARIFEAAVIILFISIIAFNQLPPTGQQIASSVTTTSTTSSAQTTTTTWPDRCGRPCPHEGGVGILDIKGDCIDIKKYYDDKMCCIDEDCGKDYKCENGFCAVPSPITTTLLEPDLIPGTIQYKKIDLRGGEQRALFSADICNIGKSAVTENFLVEWTEIFSGISNEPETDIETISLTGRSGSGPLEPGECITSGIQRHFLSGQELHGSGITNVKVRVDFDDRIYESVESNNIATAVFDLASD